MSKSLKNFTSIADFLSQNGTHASRQFRLFCLLSHYRAPVELSSERMSHAASMDDRIKSFLSTTKSVCLDGHWKYPAFNPDDGALGKEYE